MAVSFASFEIARSGLTVSERGLNVTGHNISNVNTPGYTRQQAMITTGPYQNEYKYQLGLGADIQQVRQIRHAFLDNIYRQESTTLGYWTAKNKTFQDVQSILGEPMGSGLQDTMNQFWDSWQELSKEPDSLTVRALVRQRAGALTQQVNHVGAQLDKLQSDLNSEIQVRIDEVNQITDQIAKLNVEILKNEVSKDTANDYRDQRNTLVDRLSKLVNADVNEMQDGQLDITLGGYFLVTKGIQTKLYAGESQPGSMFNVPKLEGTNIEVPLRSGTIKGLMESRGEVSGATGSVSNGSPYTKADIAFVVDNSDSNAAGLANIKANIANYVNELQQTGVDYNIRLITYGSNATLNATTYDSSNISQFITDVQGISINAGDTSNNFGNLSADPLNNDVLETLGGMSFRQGANKYALVFTNESIDGNGVTDTSATATNYVNTLKGLGIKTSVITDAQYQDNGDATTEPGWSSITGASGGRIYDINSSDFAGMMTSIGLNNANDGISLVKDTGNVIPDIRKRLNALINIMAREVNAMHRSGKTLKGTQGDDFFSAINSAYPIQMGNIKLNDNITSGITDLNNIVASTSGASGDNTIARKIANLRNMPEMQDVNGALSLDEYYQSIILSVGTNGSDAQNIMSNQQGLVTSADNQRQAITGVSMDEEMTNMMKYKYAYDASSRAINVIDQMLGTVIEKMGLAGR